MRAIGERLTAQARDGQLMILHFVESARADLHPRIRRIPTIVRLPDLLVCQFTELEPGELIRHFSSDIERFRLERLSVNQVLIFDIRR